MRRSGGTVSTGEEFLAGPRDVGIGPLSWLLAVGSLPLFELGTLSVLFDSSDLVARGGRLGWLVAATGELARAVVPLLAALALVAAARLTDLTRAIGPALRGPRPWIALAVHLVCTVAAMWLTALVFALPAAGSALLAAWVACGAAAAASWLAALLPSVGRAERGPLVAGTLGVAAGLGLLAAGAATVTRGWWEPFGRATLLAVYGALRGFGYEVGAEPEHFLVGTPRFVAEITPYCSGYQGVGLILAFLGAYLYLFRDRLRFPRALWLLPLGAALAWVLNAVRIAALVAIGDAGHETIAVEGFHYHAGTLLFCATALALGFWAGRSRTFGTMARERAWVADAATAAYVLPFLALLATSLVTGLVSRDGVDAFYGLRALVAGLVLWRVHGHLAGAGWRMSASGLVLGVVAFGVWLGLASRGAGANDFQAALVGLDPAVRGIWLTVRLLGGIVIVPLVEELAFRGYLARRLMAADFESVPLARVSWVATCAAAAVFGLMHQDALAATAVGVLYGLAARRTGQLGDAVVAHAVTNALLASRALFPGG